jgi:hypothetical protein
MERGHHSLVPTPLMNDRVQKQRTGRLAGVAEGLRSSIQSVTSLFVAVQNEAIVSAIQLLSIPEKVIAACDHVHSLGIDRATAACVPQILQLEEQVVFTELPRHHCRSPSVTPENSEAVVISRAI